MTLFRFALACAPMLAIASPAFAQSAPGPASPGALSHATVAPAPDAAARPPVRSKEEMEAMRTCLNGQMKDIGPQIKSQMADWKAKNPNATEQEQRAELQSVVNPLQKAAFKTCQDTLSKGTPKQ